VAVSHFHSYGKTSNLSTFDGEPVTQVEVIVCLGFAIDKLLTMAKHVGKRDQKFDNFALCCWPESATNSGVAWL
jgi:hypothetical protein